MTNRASLAAAVLAVVLAVTLIVVAIDTRAPASPVIVLSPPVQTPGPTQTARVEWRYWPSATVTSTPLRYTQTRIARTEEARVLQTATAILGRTPTAAMAADVEGQGT